MNKPNKQMTETAKHSRLSEKKQNKINTLFVKKHDENGDKTEHSQQQPPEHKRNVTQRTTGTLQTVVGITKYTR